MIYQMPNGQIIKIPFDVWINMSDEEIQDLVGSDKGTNIVPKKKVKMMFDEDVDNYDTFERISLDKIINQEEANNNDNILEEDI